MRGDHCAGRSGGCVVTVRWDHVEVGAQVPAGQFPLTRADLIRYAGASGDFNVIHWNERVARDLGLPDVIAHGMLTMAESIRIVTDWTGDPGCVVDYRVRFTRPVVIPDGSTALVEVTGTVAEKLEGGLVRVDLRVSSAGQTVLARAQALVRLA